MTLHSLLSFQGRFGRKQYWLFGVGVPLLVLLVLAVALIGIAAVVGQALLPFINLLVIVLYMPVLMIWMTSSAKRLHDLGRSGWFGLLNFVPVVSLGMFIWLGFVRGQTGANKFGADPLEGSVDSEAHARLPVLPAMQADCHRQPSEDEPSFEEWGRSARSSDRGPDATVPALAPRRRGLPVTLHVAGRGASQVSLDAPLTLGRSASCELPFPDDPLVSLRHARLSNDRGVVVIADQNSSNGTFLNGARIHAAEPVSDGDLIVIGSTEMRVRF